MALLSLVTSACYYDNAEELYKDFPKKCDVSAVSYKSDVKLILDMNCIGCHGKISPEAGLDLTEYQNVEANAENIKDRINRPAADQLLMPQGGPMSRCDIDKVTAWIDAGALNN